MTPHRDDSHQEMMNASAPRGVLGDLALLFLRLGTTAFGGPVAHIAMMEDEIVRRRQWLTSDAFLELIGATNLIPGPNSTEMAMHIGRERGGPRGLVVAGCAFILPAAAITGGLAWSYVRFGSIPEAQGVLYGVKAVVIAVVLQALVHLAPAAIKSVSLGILGGAAVLAAALGGNELVILALAGGAAMALQRRTPPNRAAFMVAPIASLGVVSSVAAPTLGGLFWVFAKIGSVLFGSGYVLLAFLRSDLVERLHWITEAELLDAVAVGQITPGPVFTTATFIGYVVGGGAGAVAATVGIFLPAFVFVGLSALLLPHLRRSPTFRAFLDGVNVASLGLMAVVTTRLGRAAIVDVVTAGLAVVSAVLLMRFKVNSTWLILGGAVVGVSTSALR